MLAKPVQFLAILFMALALVPGGAHLFELSNKIGLGEDAYFAVQQIYAGWALFGIVLFGALTVNLALAIVLRGDRPAFHFATIGFLAVVANLAIFFTWTFPDQSGDGELDRSAAELGNATHAVGVFARRQRARHVRRLPERDAGGADRPQSRLRAVRSVCYSFPRRSPFSAAIWSDSIGR